MESQHIYMALQIIQSWDQEGNWEPSSDYLRNAKRLHIKPDIPNTYEVLARDKAGSAGFITEFESDDLIELDCKILDLAMELLKSPNRSKARLHINLEPSTVMSDRFPEYLAKLKGSRRYKEWLVIEITERSVPDAQIDELRNRVSEIYDVGFAIALDDYSIQAPAPHHKALWPMASTVKVDMVELYNAGLDKMDPFNAAAADKTVVVERIEKREEKRAIEALKTQDIMLQGYFFGRPEIMPDFSAQLPRSARPNQEAGNTKKYIL